MPNMNEPLPMIPFGTRPKILFLGNGVNRLFGGMSWTDIIVGTAKSYNAEYDEAVYKSMPAVMQIIAASQGHVHAGMNDLSRALLKITMTEQQRTFLQSVLSLPFDQILTANYTYELEEVLLPGWNRSKSVKHTFFSVEKVDATNDMMLHQFVRIGDRHIWHIHGYAYKPSSVIMGQYYYGKLISQAQSYTGKFMKRYKTSIAAGKDYQPLSWLDYFLMGDVYMLGFGMDLSEMDLWWLACCKQRNIPESRIYYMARSISEEKRILMDAYGIEQVIIPAETNENFYDEAIRKLGMLKGEIG